MLYPDYSPLSKHAGMYCKFICFLWDVQYIWLTWTAASSAANPCCCRVRGQVFEKFNTPHPQHENPNSCFVPLPHCWLTWRKVFRFIAKHPLHVSLHFPHLLLKFSEDTKNICSCLLCILITMPCRIIMEPVREVKRGKIYSNTNNALYIYIYIS